MTQRQRLATFDTRAPVYAKFLSTRLHSHRNQIFLGGQHRGACELSLGLYCTSQQLLERVAPNTYMVRAVLNASVSDDVHISSGFYSRHLSSMTQGGPEMMVRQCSSAMGKVDKTMQGYLKPCQLRRLCGECISSDIPQRVHR